MKDLYLRFPDEATADAVMAGIEADAVSVIGTIYEPLGAMIDGEYPPPTAVQGWHVNVRWMDDPDTPESLVEYMVAPEVPARVWL